MVQLAVNSRMLGGLDGRISKPKFSISGIETTFKQCATFTCGFMTRANCSMISTNRRGERIVMPAYIPMLIGEAITLEWNPHSGISSMWICRGSFPKDSRWGLWDQEMDCGPSFVMSTNRYYHRILSTTMLSSWEAPFEPFSKEPFWVISSRSILLSESRDISPEQIDP